MSFMNKITSKKIENLIGLKSNTLHYYIKSGALVPEIDEGVGTGHTREFSAKNFLEACMIKRLIDFGYSKNMILKFFESINRSREWREINTKQIIKDRIIFIIIFYRSGDEIVCQFDKSKPSIRSFADITDDQFIDSLKNPSHSNEFNLDLIINKTMELFSVINISAVIGEFFHIFDPKK